MFWKNVILYEIYSKKSQWPNTFCSLCMLLNNVFIEKYRFKVDVTLSIQAHVKFKIRN